MDHHSYPPPPPHATASTISLMQRDYEKGLHITAPSKSTKIADPGALGLFSFASTTFILSFYNVGARHIAHTNVVLGMAVACGGLAQLLAGMWEFPKGNTFGATAFTSYGAFWISYALIILPGTGVITAYTDQTEFESAVGIYLMAWFIVTTLFFIGALRKSIAFMALFFCLLTTFFLLAMGALTGVKAVHAAGGGVGILTAFIAFYIGLSVILANEEDPIFKLPLGTFSKRY